jgi:hypothetical protein
MAIQNYRELKKIEYEFTNQNSIIIPPNSYVKYILILTVESPEPSNKEVLTMTLVGIKEAKNIGLERSKLKLIKVLFADNEEFKDSNALINEVILDKSGENLEYLIAESDEIFEEKLSCQWRWWAVGLMQCHYLLGTIANPEEMIADFFGETFVERIKPSVLIDAALYNCLKSIFKDVQFYFESNGLPFKYKSPFDLHTALVREQMELMMMSPYRRYDAAFHKVRGIRAEKQEKTLFINYLKGRKLKPELSLEFSRKLNEDLLGQVLLALRYYRSKRDHKHYYLNLIDSLKRHLPAPANDKVWVDGKKYVKDFSSHSLKPNP